MEIDPLTIEKVKQRIKTLSPIIENVKKMQKDNKLLQTQKYLDKLKSHILKYIFPMPKEVTSHEKTLYEYGRYFNEVTVLCAILQGDLKEFESNMEILKVFYFDLAEYLPPSELQQLILSLHLLSCLASSNEAEFYSCLERISTVDKGEKHVHFVLEVKKCLDEGAYSKILTSPLQLPSHFQKFFVDSIVARAIDRHSAAIEKAYREISFDSLISVLHLENEDQLKELCVKRQWDISGKKVVFAKPAEKPSIDTAAISKMCLCLANQVERIV